MIKQLQISVLSVDCTRFTRWQNVNETVGKPSEKVTTCIIQHKKLKRPCFVFLELRRKFVGREQSPICGRKF